MIKTIYNQTEHTMDLSVDGNPWFSIPVAVSVNDQIFSPELKEKKDENFLFCDDHCVLNFKILNISLKILCHEYSKDNSKKLPA